MIVASFATHGSTSLAYVKCIERRTPLSSVAESDKPIIPAQYESVLSIVVFVSVSVPFLYCGKIKMITVLCLVIK